MKNELSLMNLVNKIKFDEKQMKIHPEKKNMLRRHINVQKELLVQICLNNADNPLLNNIIMRGE